MPDLPVAEGGRPGGSGGGSHWLVIGAIAGVGTLAVLLLGKGGGGGSGTTAAGTSINAALGSIQEQNLNLMGQLGASTAALSTQASDYNASELAAMSGMQNALSDQMAGIDTHLVDVNTSLSNQLSDVNGNVISGNQAAASYYANLWNQLGQMSGLQQWIANMSQATYDTTRSTYQGVIDTRNDIAAVRGDIGGVSQQVSGVGNAVQYSTQQTQQYGNTLYQYIAQLQAQIASLLKGSAPASSSSGSSGGGGGHVQTYTINLPGGGQIRTNASSYAAAVNNVAGMGY